MPSEKTSGRPNIFEANNNNNNNFTKKQKLGVYNGY